MARAAFDRIRARAARDRLVCGAADQLVVSATMRSDAARDQNIALRGWHNGAIKTESHCQNIRR